MLAFLDPPHQLGGLESGGLTRLPHAPHGSLQNHGHKITALLMTRWPGPQSIVINWDLLSLLGSAVPGLLLQNQEEQSLATPFVPQEFLQGLSE